MNKPLAYIGVCADNPSLQTLTGSGKGKLARRVCADNLRNALWLNIRAVVLRQ